MPEVASFVDVTRIVTMFFKIIFIEIKKVLIVRNYVPKSNLYLHFLTWQNLLTPDEKMWGASHDSYIFWVFFM